MTSTLQVLDIITRITGRDGAQSPCEILLDSLYAVMSREAFNLLEECSFRSIPDPIHHFKLWKVRIGGVWYLRRLAPSDTPLTWDLFTHEILLLGETGGIPLNADDAEIPPITEPLGRYWEQPDRALILIDAHHAVMDAAAFAQLLEYSCSKPTAVYEGKMWKAQFDGVWYLRWFGTSCRPGYVSNNARVILLLEEPGGNS